MRVLFEHGLVALSKPRCGSTSLRRMLAPHMEEGDIKCDRGDEAPPLHPHITAPYLRKVLSEKGYDSAALTYIITIRHPVELLWSYWKFFKPDSRGRYFFSKGWTGNETISFEEWIIDGELAMNRNWLALAPEWISPRNLSPLSLEARAMQRDGSWAVDRVFKLEEPDVLADFLSVRLGCEVAPRHVNASVNADMPRLGKHAMECIRKMFPYETNQYNV